MKDWLTPSPPLPVDELPEPPEQQVAARPQMPPMLQNPAMRDAQPQLVDRVPLAADVDRDLGDEDATTVAVAG